MKVSQGVIGVTPSLGFPVCSWVKLGQMANSGLWVTGITYKVFDITNLPGTEVASGTLTVADVVFDTLQTDSRWTKDSTGYNFRHAMPASAFASGGKIYQVEYLFDPSSGENFFVVFKVTAKEVFSS